MRKWFAALLMTLLVLGLAACGEESEATSGNEDGGNSKEDVIKIGSVIDASGSAAPLGKGKEDTMKMLVKEANANGGINGKQIKLITIDSKSDQNEAVLGIKKLIDQEKVDAIVGGTISGNALAMIPLAEKAGVPFIAFGASVQINKPSDGSARNWTFKTSQGDDIVIPKLLEYLKSEGLTKVAWLGVANSYGTSGHEEFEKIAAEYGIEAIIEEEFEATVNDAKPMLTRVKKENPQAIIVWGTVQESAIVTKNIRELGIDIPIFASHGIGSKQFFELAGDAAKGVVFPGGKLLVAEQLDDSDKQKANIIKYKNDFEKEFNYESSTFGGHAWDAFFMLKEAIESAGTDPEDLRSALESINDFAGISGVFNMTSDNHNGLASDALVMVKIDDDGEWIIAE